MKPVENLSIILPIFNGQDFIEDAVNSIINQKQLPNEYEIILIDDCSLDRSLELCNALVRKFRCIKVISFDKNQGVAAARNFGIINARYNHICFIDQDDTWSPYKLFIQFKVAQEFKNIDYILGHQDFHLHEIPSAPKWVEEKWLEHPQKGYVFGTILIEKATFIKVGLLNSNLLYGGDDVDWFARAKDNGMISFMLTETILHRKIHISNASRRTSQSNPELINILKAKLDRAKYGTH